jgi:asparagine synthase (glutamine-hydrolysing)
MTRIWKDGEKAFLWPVLESRNSDCILDELYANAESHDPLDQTLSVYQKSWLVEDLLMKADKMSMAVSLELRVPFLDYRLVEWANRQPQGVRIGRQGRQYITKYVLRRFAEKRLPQEIIRRPKQGFPVPIYRWLAGHQFNRWARGYIAGKDSRLKHVFEHAAMEAALSQAAAGNAQSASQTWLLIVLETWLREFDVEVVDGTFSRPSATLVLD